MPVPEKGGGEEEKVFFSFVFFHGVIRNVCAEGYAGRVPCCNSYDLIVKVF